MVLRDTVESQNAFAYGAVTLYGWPFQAASASDLIGNSLRDSVAPADRPYNTATATATSYHAATVWAPPLSLATTQGMFSAPRGTEMFQFPRFPRPAYGFG